MSERPQKKEQLGCPYHYEKRLKLPFAIRSLRWRFRWLALLGM
jgi:hypothetical protein